MPYLSTDDGVPHLLHGPGAGKAGLPNSCLDNEPHTLSAKYFGIVPDPSCGNDGFKTATLPTCPIMPLPSEDVLFLLQRGFSQ